MKNPVNYIREAVYAALNGAITYNDGEGFNGVVPVYGEDDGEVTKYQVQTGDTTVNPRRNKNSRMRDIDQTIEVISERNDAARKYIDDIGELVGTALEGLAGNEVWQVTLLDMPRQSYIKEESGEGTIINRLILRYTFTIIEK